MAAARDEVTGLTDKLEATRNAIDVPAFQSLITTAASVRRMQ